jgi:UDP-N-acetylenolpyruvoylglucosamine reductase
MTCIDETLARLREIPQLTVSERTPLSQYTRFGIGGPADVYVETSDESAFIAGLSLVRESDLKYVVIGGGTNLIVSDHGFRGIVLRYTASRISANGHSVSVDAGAALQDLVDFTIDAGLQGLETMTGIPGSVGAAIYGNAGAYGHSISECVDCVRFVDGEGVRSFQCDECCFEYRESIFKRRKEWVILSADLRLSLADPAKLRETADGILRMRNQKYPPTMKCAGSIFKNLLLADLPPELAAQIPARVIREGKVPSAYFLEAAGAKGMKNGDIQVADYHANLIYNSGQGTAAQLREIITELKKRVHERFGLQLEEEVQYVGFD